MKHIKKSLALTIAVVMLSVAVIGGSLAWLNAETGIITNIFKAPTVDIDIDENIEGNVKEAVQVKNNGEIPVYVRVAIVVTWKDDKGNVYPVAPKRDENYSWTRKYSTINGTREIEGCDWNEFEGFYYYFDFDKHSFKVLEPEEITSSLVENVKQIGEAPKGYSLSVEIISQAIQANPEDVIEDAWGVRVSEFGWIEPVGLPDGDNINGMDIPGGSI